MFNKIVKIPRSQIDWCLVSELSELLLADTKIDSTDFLTLPNATKAGIKKLHKAHIAARKALK